MTTQNDTAQAMGEAAALPSATKTAPAIRWIPCLLIQGERTACGMTTSYPERLPGLFDTPAQAMTAAAKAIRQRPDAIGYTAKRELGGQHAA